MRPSPYYNLTRSQPNEEVRKLSDVLMECTSKREHQPSMAGDNTEKIWAHRFFGNQKTDVPKPHKMATEGLGSASSWRSGGKAPQKFLFFSFKARQNSDC